MTIEFISEEQREALQEVANIGMGQAGASIAKVLGEFVELSVPQISAVDAAGIPAALVALAGDGIASAVRQAFIGELRGEAIVIFAEHSADDLAALLAYGDALDGPASRELLLDISNVLVGACLGGIAELLRTTIGFSAPSLLADQVATSQLLRANEISARCALLVEVRFGIEKRVFRCHLVMLMPDDAVAALRRALDRFVEEL
ncbi:chemotaxis protein CheC [Candidatus Accumulibacter sp. ACC007]|uniref:chemotaxis protein CheC n=1 Tax=Candidatus Accumulibacter sp. ACC007 TaxID=2823333 RepID=UPI0025C44B66|nr:chemotaxis protein CheC [Candidatus Accumulibacter sp. ACC007]